MEPNGRRDMPFEGLFRLIFRILLKLVLYVAMNRLGAFFNRHVVVAHHAGLECPFVAVERGAPWILGIGRVAPRAVLPDYFRAAKVEGRRLCIRNIRLALL